MNAYKNISVVGLLAALIMLLSGGMVPAAAQDDTEPLTETYTLESGYSFSHPQGWVVDYELNEPDISLATLGSNATVAKQGGFSYDYAPGDVWVSWTWETLSNFSGELTSDSSPVDVLKNSIVGIYPDMDDAYEIELGGHTVALAESVPEAGIPMMAVFFFWDDDTICWLLALAAPGEYEQVKPTLLAIAESALPDTGLPTQDEPQTVPNLDSGVPKPAATEEIRQWASRARATSQYSDTDWSAQQATGAPDTAGCEDVATAWASSAADGVDTLTVFFSTPVVPTQVNIYQTYNPGAITSVELIPAKSGPVIPIPNSADHHTGCPGIFTLDVPAGLTGERLVQGVAIRLDQRDHTGWNEIDAVELVGEAIPRGEPDATLPPLPAAVVCDLVALGRGNMRSGPGTNYNAAGQLSRAASMSANGQATGADSYTWWRLTSGSWVRGDLVDAANCASLLPIVSVDDPLPLTQRYVSPDGFSFDYPQDWVLSEEPGGATIGNSQEAAQNAFGERYEAGEFQASIRWSTIDELVPDTGLAAGATPMQVLRAAISVSSGFDMNEPYELQVGNHVVAAAYGTFNDANVEIAVVIFEAKNGLYGSVLTGSDLRGLKQFEPTLRAIIASALAGSFGD